MEWKAGRSGCGENKTEEAEVGSNTRLDIVCLERKGNERLLQEEDLADIVGERQREMESGEAVLTSEMGLLAEIVEKNPAEEVAGEERKREEPEAAAADATEGEWVGLRLDGESATGGGRKLRRREEREG